MIQFDEYKQKINALAPKLTELHGAMGIDAASVDLAAIEAEVMADGFWNDVANTQKVLQRQKQLKDKIASYVNLVSLRDDALVMVELAIEAQDDTLFGDLQATYAALEQGVDSAILATLLKGEYDKNNAIISFHAGAGGTEAQDWAEMLFRMYTRWAERRGFKWTTLDYLDGDEAGLKSAVISVEGENAYGYLKGENGVHRLVRISPFDSASRRHTSFSAVEVMPEITDASTIDIRDDDLRVDTYRSGGAGGQHVNKTESAIRITHIPSGVVVSCQNERSQHQNREVAMRMLRSKLAEIKEREHLDRIEDIKGVQMNIEWGSQIRSYVFMPYQLAKDHRTGFENGNISAVMDGDLDGFMSAYLKALALGTL